LLVLIAAFFIYPEALPVAEFYGHRRLEGCLGPLVCLFYITVLSKDR
jgi:hypothetical protein